MTEAERLAIEELLSRYVHLVDDADWDRLDEIFTPDGVFDLTAIGKGVPEGLDELRVCYAGLDHPLAHHTTNIVIEPAGPGAARVRSKYLVVRADGMTGSGEYHDEAVSGEAGWRLRRRTVFPRRPQV